MPELIDEGVSGHLVADVSEAVEAVHGVEGLDRRACRRHVEERFTSERMAREYLAVYRQILGSCKKASVGDSEVLDSDRMEGEHERSS